LPWRRRSRSTGIVGIHPVHALCRDRKQQFQHPVADPGAGRAELALAAAIAAGKRNHAFRARAATMLAATEELKAMMEGAERQAGGR
jgi:hypothetical protein